MLKNTKAKLAAAVAAVALAVTGGGAAYAATSSPAAPFRPVACVEYGKPGSVQGNVMLYDWNGSKCPAGTYAVDLAQAVDDDPAAPDFDPKPVDIDPVVTVTPSPSVSASSTASPTPAG